MIIIYVYDNITHYLNWIYADKNRSFIYSIFSLWCAICDYITPKWEISNYLSWYTPFSWTISGYNSILRGTLCINVISLIFRNYGLISAKFLKYSNPCVPAAIDLYIWRWRINLEIAYLPDVYILSWSNLTIM